MYVSLNETMSVFSDEFTQDEENHHTNKSTNHVLIREWWSFCSHWSVLSSVYYVHTRLFRHSLLFLCNMHDHGSMKSHSLAKELMYVFSHWNDKEGDQQCFPSLIGTIDERCVRNWFLISLKMSLTSRFFSCSSPPPQCAYTMFNHQCFSTAPIW